MIEKRTYKRFPVTLQAKVIIKGKTFEGIIGNVSEEGLAYNVTTMIETTDQFNPAGPIDLFVHVPSGETIKLQCEIRWFVRPSSGRQALIMGMNILEPPSAYKEWVKEVEDRLSQPR